VRYGAGIYPGLNKLDERSMDEIRQDLQADIDAHAASSEPQEWTPEYVGNLLQSVTGGLKRVADAHKAALAAKQEKRDEMLLAIVTAKTDLVKAQQANKPLVEALKTIADADPNRVGQSQYKIIAIKALKLHEAALAKVKEGK
jgi:hypothetical protein